MEGMYANVKIEPDVLRPSKAAGNVELEDEASKFMNELWVAVVSNWATFHD